MNLPPLFDHYTDSYDDELNRALAVTGEDKAYYAQGRLTWLSRCLKELAQQPRSAMDYGCGIGSATPLLLAVFDLKEVVGVDVSSRSIAIAREKYGASPIQFSMIAEYVPAGTLDLVYCNGVFHHIEKLERPAALDFIHRSLRPGGVFAFWENNPWNPATRYVMSRCSFDREAKTVSVLEATRLLRQWGFTITRMDFLFIFPNFLRALRPVERWACKLPIGAQYQILARKGNGVTEARPLDQRSAEQD